MATGEMYHLEDIKKALPGWTPSKADLHYNNKRFLGQEEREIEGEKTSKPLQRTEGGEKTLRPILKSIQKKKIEDSKEEKPKAVEKIKWNRGKLKKYNE